MDRKRIIAGGSVVVILVIVLVYALVHSSLPAPTPKPAPVVHPKTTQNKPASPQSSAANNTSGTASNSSGQQSLSDTGPGDLAAVFVVASVVGYAVCLRVLARTRNTD
jgi:hypothetical protein